MQADGFGNAGKRIPFYSRRGIPNIEEIMAIAKERLDSEGFNDFQACVRDTHMILRNLEERKNELAKLEAHRRIENNRFVLQANEGPPSQPVQGAIDITISDPRQRNAKLVVILPGECDALDQIAAEQEALLDSAQLEIGRWLQR